MTWSDLPSLNSLRVFATVAEAGSYTQAGASLNVTHSAVSQQVKALELRLGTTLVTREGRSVALTEEGVMLARDLATGFNTIQKSIEVLTGIDATRPVQFTMSPAFAVSWLMPRILDFQNKHPEVTLMLNPTGKVVELTPGGVDIAIRYCDGHLPGLETAPLLLPDFVVVGTPELVGTTNITVPVTLLELPWLQELDTNEVAEWFERQNVRLTKPLIINHMPGNLIMEAVRRGDGITYTSRSFVDADIRSGKLVELFKERNPKGYYVATLPGVLRPTLRAFVTWIKQQAANDPTACL
jgi:LysR family glycine cleavage system transcriptional activator